MTLDGNRSAYTISNTTAGVTRTPSRRHPPRSPCMARHAPATFCCDRHVDTRPGEARQRHRGHLNSGFPTTRIKNNPDRNEKLHIPLFGAGVALQQLHPGARNHRTAPAHLVVWDSVIKAACTPATRTDINEGKAPSRRPHYGRLRRCGLLRPCIGRRNRRATTIFYLATQASPVRCVETADGLLLATTAEGIVSVRPGAQSPSRARSRPTRPAHRWSGAARKTIFRKGAAPPILRKHLLLAGHRTAHRRRRPGKARHGRDYGVEPARGEGFGRLPGPSPARSTPQRCSPRPPTEPARKPTLDFSRGSRPDQALRRSPRRAFLSPSPAGLKLTLSTADGKSYIIEERL